MMADSVCHMQNLAWMRPTSIVYSVCLYNQNQTTKFMNLVDALQNLNKEATLHPANI